ncbi:heavy-metal-associated domain-containing protein [Sediminibacterium ginsengisoli]|uniref:Copper chaperone CopZ n=1 Tax=Sediminibacterium ginsengisoli TaxID=413434 RepID=A0A1T4KYH9_9BACT|nr:heavy-metal-associated domain-containing protein [Sediminibacterium ginsengisoli]SJZ47502.1 hypothetical protein SAMN04488132_102193 [Sediminibacterium ginsengisoli]
MKTKSLFFSIAFILFATVSMAQSKTKSAVASEEIKVWGNCGMCKSNIEKAAKEGGATTAVWNKDTHILSVKYPSAKTGSKQIQQKIADAGYDTQDLKGNTEAYMKLDECCQYERKADKKDDKPQSEKN